MANDMMSTLKNMLGDNADEKIQSVIQGLTASNSDEYTDTSDSGEIPQFNANDYVSQIKGIINQMEHSNDSRSNLLLSLKPYMRAERKRSIDSAVRLLNLTRIAGLFK